MSLDECNVKVSYALKMAKKYYSKDTYNHALRVMQYVANNKMIPYMYREDCISLAIMHDLIEDTEYNFKDLPKNFKYALLLLSKPKGMDYTDYIKNIKNTDGINYRECAYWVKLADMKDHLAQKETLTDRLKEKYLNALAYLL